MAIALSEIVMAPPSPLSALLTAETANEFGVPRLISAGYLFLESRETALCSRSLLRLGQSHAPVFGTIIGSKLLVCHDHRCVESQHLVPDR